MRGILCLIFVSTICFFHYIFTTHTFSTIVNPSSLSVRCPLYAVLCGSLSHTCLLYQTLCCLCGTALTAQFIWWPYVVPPQVDPKLCLICCTVQFTQSHLFAVPNTVVSVQYHSHTPVYMLTICSASTGG